MHLSHGNGVLAFHAAQTVVVFFLELFVLQSSGIDVVLRGNLSLLSLPPTLTTVVLCGALVNGRASIVAALCRLTAACVCVCGGWGDGGMLSSAFVRWTWLQATHARFQTSRQVERPGERGCQAEIGFYTGPRAPGLRWWWWRRRRQTSRACQSGETSLTNTPLPQPCLESLERNLLSTPKIPHMCVCKYVCE